MCYFRLFSHLLCLTLLISIETEAQINTFPYLEEFETPSANWTVTTVNGTSWETGVPTAAGTSGAYSGTGCAGTDLDSGYMASSETYLTSPLFDISTILNPLLSFYQFRYMSQGLDGMHVEYTTDDITWFRIGTTGSPNSYNWYNSAAIFATGLPAFTGNSNGWLQSGYYLQGLTAGIIRFRFVFRSNINFGSAQPGVFIDDFKIEDSINPIADLWASTNPGLSTTLAAGVKTALNLRVSNYSSVTTVDSAYIGYTLNGALQSNTYRFINLAPNTTDTIFIDSITLPAGNFFIRSFASFTFDPNRNNDTVSFGGNAIAYATLPYSDDFESTPMLWYEQSLNPTTHWELGYPNFNQTTGTHSGVNAWDINLDTSYNYNATSYLYSPIFNLSGPTSYELRFWQNCQSESKYDGTRIEYSIDSGNTWLTLGSQNDPYGYNWYNYYALLATGFPGWAGSSGGWIQSRYRLTNFIGASAFSIRFVFESDNVINEDGISIDDIEIASIPDYDASYVSLNNNSLNTAAGLNSGNITIKFLNAGTLPINSFTASYSVNGIIQQSQVFTQTVNPLDTGIAILPGFISPAGTYTICGAIDLALDADTSNNDGCFVANGVAPMATPYSDDFESGSPGWTTSFANPTTLWELGTPNYGVTNSVHSGSNCWDVNLVSSYSTNAYSTLTSPVFDVSTIGIFGISFWANYFSELGWDGVRMEYSTNGGSTWAVLGYMGDPLGSNWYDNNILASSNLPGWCDNSAGWKKITYRFDPFTGINYIQFRFIFTSDNSIVKDGFSIDDFSVYPIPDLDAEIISITPAHIFPAAGTHSYNLQLDIRNAGSQTYSGVTVGYLVNGIPQQSIYYSSLMAPLNTKSFSLPGFIPSNGAQDVCAYVHLVNDNNSSNDTTCIILTGTPQYTPYFQDNFDGVNKGWNTATTGNPLTQWEAGTPNYGQTNSAYSAPNCWDINLQTAYSPDAMTYLYSPWFDLTASLNPILSFMQNRNTYPNNEGFYIEWTSQVIPTWSLLGYFNQGTATNWYNDQAGSPFPGAMWDGSSSGWIESKMPLTGIIPTTSPVQFRIVFQSSSLPILGDGVSIDDFKIDVTLANDAELVSVISPGTTTIQNSSVPVQVVLRNHGTIPLTTLDLKYSLNGGPVVSSTWTGQLPFDSIAIVTLPSIFPIAGINTLRVYVSWGSDLNQLNDTLDFNFTGIATSGLPYFNDFESGSGYWMSSGTTSTQWQYGTPNFAGTSSAYSGDSCWDINLNTPYNNLGDAILTSPIFDLNQYNIITLSFWHNYITEQNADGMFVEYSNNGTIWQPLGNIGDPNGTNWYNSTIYQSHEGWSGNSSGWKNSSYIYNKPFGNNYFQLRFRFISDFNLVNAGVSVDDISLSGVVGIPENSAGGQLFVYPNPASEAIHVQTEVSYDATVSLIQSDGKTVIAPVAFNGEHTFSIAQLQDGIYYLVVKDAKYGTRVEKVNIVKQ